MSRLFSMLLVQACLLSSEFPVDGKVDPVAIEKVIEKNCQTDE